MGGEIKILEFIEGVTVGAPVEVLSSVVITTVDYAAQSEDDYIEIDASANTVDVTLLAAVGNTGRSVHVKASNITFRARILPQGAETIDGASSYTFTTQYESIHLISNGTAWRII